jgi:hypothetical protein
MKIYKVLCASLLMAAAGATGYAQAPTDTIINAQDADVVVSQNRNGLNVEVKNLQNGGYQKYRYEYEPNEKYSVSRTYTNLKMRCSEDSPFSVIFSGFSVGFIKALDAPAGARFATGKSIELTLDQLLGLEWHSADNHNAVSVGLGLNWRNYRTGGDRRFTRPEGSDAVTLAEYGEGITPDFSRLKTFSLQFPIRYNWHLRSSLNLGLSVILNANTYCKLCTKYTVDSEKGNFENTEHVSSLLRKFTVDFKANVQFCPLVALYVRYSPMKVFKAGMGPDITPLSAGFTFLY